MVYKLQHFFSSPISGPSPSVEGGGYLGCLGGGGGAKQHRLDVDHSSTSIANVKHKWSYFNFPYMPSWCG